VRLGLILAAVLAGTWLMLSGHTEPLILGFGVVSVAAVVAVSMRMGIVDEEGAPTALRPLGVAAYVPWLLWQVVLSGLDVSRRILSPGLAISPRVVSVEPSQRSTIGKVLYANSITLTPGTVSVRMYDGSILVHALHEGTASDLEGGEMDRRVAAVEGLG
jgi:multicomponent Na+:H+ antiporter subunit E